MEITPAGEARPSNLSQIASPSAGSQSAPAPQETIDLDETNRRIDALIDAGDPGEAARVAQGLLRRIPRHLMTYLQMLEIAWQLRRWEEGEDWGRRVLQADPGNAWAWRALAQSAEERGLRAQAFAIWQRAFEMSPYDPEIRAGVSRTGLNQPNALGYNLACLAALYHRGQRWGHAADAYRTLVKADPRRVDFQLCLAVALWQTQQTPEAYALARHLTQAHPHLLMGWVVLHGIGDENDQALARSPIQTMDPTGAFAAQIWGVYPDKVTV
jgi:tetratricopeptide (TPR) repeat protein